MCHGGYVYKGKKGPVWKITDDGRHIIFYGRYGVCETATSWCREHCYLKTKPTKVKIDPEYTFINFTAENISANEELSVDVGGAKYVTMFSSGTLGGIGNFYNCDLEEIIHKVCKIFYDKRVMFFVRQRLDFVKLRLKKPANAVIVLSLDTRSEMNLINWGIDSDLVNAISIVEHVDNARLLTMVKAVTTNTATCDQCDDYDCFNIGKGKGLIICGFQC